MWLCTQNFIHNRLIVLVFCVLKMELQLECIIVEFFATENCLAEVVHNRLKNLIWAKSQTRGRAANVPTAIEEGEMMMPGKPSVWVFDISIVLGRRDDQSTRNRWGASLILDSLVLIMLQSVKGWDQAVAFVALTMHHRMQLGWERQRRSRAAATST